MAEQKDDIQYESQQKGENLTEEIAKYGMWDKPITLVFNLP